MLIAVLSKLENIEDAPSDVAYLIARDYGRLPNVQKLLYKMAKTKHEETAQAVANAIAHNYDNLPDDIRKLLYKLADSNKTAGAATASAVNGSFNKLPLHVREGLIRRLSKHKRYVPVLTVSNTIASNYDNQPDDIRKLLYKIVDNNKTAGADSFSGESVLR